MDPATIYDTVNARYSSIATAAHSDKARDYNNSRIASSFGYSAEELASLPAGTNLGLSCGNPLATANIKAFETMLDLGSGGGLDCLIAASQMLKAEPAPKGKIYGVDRSEAMIALARKNAAKANLPEGLVEFVQAQISNIPIEDEKIDLIVSNCVINLVPDADKPKVFKEMHRLLKPGGRVAISDPLAKKEMPDHIRSDAALLVDCIAGASQVEEYRRWIEEAGFRKESTVFVNTEKDLNVYHDGAGDAACCARETESTSCCTKDVGSNFEVDFNEWVASYQIYAIK